LFCMGQSHSMRVGPDLPTEAELSTAVIRPEQLIAHLCCTCCLHIKAPGMHKKRRSVRQPRRRRRTATSDAAAVSRAKGTSNAIWNGQNELEGW